MRSLPGVCLLVGALALLPTISGQEIKKLAGDRYSTFDDVAQWANLALDVAEMREAATKEEKLNIYMNGNNANYTDASGTVQTRSLSSLSLGTFEEMKGNPIYNFFRHGFLVIGNQVEGESLGLFDQHPVNEYANTLVTDLLEIGKLKAASEAAVVMNVWMYCVHQIYELIDACQRKDDNSRADMKRALDIAAALWIGAGQEAGDNGSGNLLYNIAEKAGARFNQDNGETKVNEEVLTAFDSYKLAIETGECENDPDAYIKYRILARKLIGYMTVPLMQTLIHHIMQLASSDNSDFIELYALSIGPRVEACVPTAYQEMLKSFVQTNFEVDEQGESIALLQSIYSCLELNCNQIGEYRSGEVPACSDDVNPENLMFAGYPLSFNAQAASRIDRDIEQIRILTKAQAYEAALDYYEHGSNAFNEDTGTFLTLKELATSSGRTEVTAQFGIFSRYFDDNDNYADKMVRDILPPQGDFTGASTAQAAELLSGVLTYLVMYMAILEKLYVAVSTCREGGGGNSTNASVLLMDEAVAFYVGSIEGAAEGGRVGGQLLYATAKELCDDFDSCTVEGDASSNVDIMQAFKDVSDDLTISECDDAEGTLLSIIAPALLVPLIQGTLKYATINEKLLKGASNETLGTGYAFSRSILPLIDAADPGKGPTLAQNMDFDLIDQPVADGAVAVFEAVTSGFQKLTTPDIKDQCQNIGILDGGAFGKICDGLNVIPRPSGTLLPTPAPTLVPGGTTPADPPSPAPTPSPVEAQPTAPTDATTLGFGRYIFTSDVARVATLALDVSDMMQAQTVKQANDTYFNGGNAGSERVVSLAELSTTAANDMHEDPIFNIFRWALLSEEVFETIGTETMDPLESAYAHIVVRKALGTAQDIELAVESAVVLSVWMEICHNLFNAINYCEDGVARAVVSIDRAVALWIGVGQKESTFDTGFLMYNIAQQGEKHFGLASGEALANTKIIDSFVDAQQVSSKCVSSSESFLELKLIVAQIVKQMTIPLLQNLLYYIDQNNDNYIELYALAVVPQAIGCGASDFIGLRDVLVSEKDFNLSDIDEVFFDEMQRFQKCLRISCDDLIGNTNPTGSTLRDLIDNICVKDSTSNTNLAGFETTTDVYELSRLDVDVLQIGIFMETKAYEAAMDYYLHGYNSQGTLKPLSLHDLATSAGRIIAPQHQLFSEYFQSNNYSDDLVQRAMKRSDVFQNASRDQAAEAVTRALQGLVSYMAVLEKLYSAVDKCKQGSGAVQSLEEGVALFVGSLEGTERGGNGAWDGTLLFALGKETCDAFDTCEASNNADVNEDMLEVLDDARDLLQSDDCAGALQVIENEVLADLPVAILQALLFYTVENAGVNTGNQTYSLAAGYVFSQSILPLVNAVNVTSAKALENNLFFDSTKKPVPDGADAIYEAITFALPGMNVDCDDIGTFGFRDVCDNTEDEVVRPDIDTSTNLGNGLYTTTTYVDDRAAIALDLVAIRGALESGSLDVARVFYKDGVNSKEYNANGIKVGQRSLQKFSTQETLDMVNEPIFNIYRYALKDSTGQYLNKDVRLYADSIVEQLLATTFTAADQKILPAEAMLVLNLWMLLAHGLFKTLHNCKNKAIAGTDGVHSIDEAVAYWIGDGQQAGDGETGHLFYALAERMGDKFQQNVDGQSRTNVNIMGLFIRAKAELTFRNACTDNPTTYPRLRRLVYRILSQMMIPLVQSLIHNLRENDRLRVKLYAQAFAPLTAACDPELFQYLQLKLIDGTYNVIEAEEVVERIRTSFDCLGISCDDVGQHVSETDNICISTPKKNPLAGYIPVVDVREYAQLDLDVLETGILMEMGAYAAVEDLYTYGKHALVDGINGPEMLTLSQMATTSDRSVVPEFDSFERYYVNNKYADRIIRGALDRSKLPNASDAQRKEIVVKGMQYLVIYMAALQAMHDAISGCDSTNASRVMGAQEAWDRAAALLVGSIEGDKAAGTLNGQSFYGLAKKRCAQFETCGNTGTSQVNEALMSLLYTGKGELEGGSCSALRRAVASIKPLLLVPLIQSNIRYAIENTRLDAFPTDADFAEGYIFSRAVLPLVEDVDRNAAFIINRNMDLVFENEPVNDGSLAVINAFVSVYAGMDVDCVLVGKVDNVEACTGADQGSSDEKLSGGSIFGIIVAVFAVVALAGWIFVRSRKERQKRQGAELTPIFSRSNGVMDHSSDVLGGKHNDAAILDGDEAYVHRMQYQADALSMT